MPANGGTSMSFNMYASGGWWNRTRSWRYVFLAGVVFGIVIGWSFHGVISLFMRFGLVFVMLLPLLALGYMWWRSSQERKRVHPTTVVRWTGQDPQINYDRAAPAGGRQTIIDLDDVRPREPQR